MNRQRNPRRSGFNPTSLRGIGFKPDLQQGFTMVELVVAISISSIVVAMMVMFLTAPMDTFIAQNRRSELAYAADSALRMLGEDVRNALPNSLRTQRNGSVVVIEMLNVTDSARYRVSGSLGDATQELDLTVADMQFATLGTFGALSHPFVTHAQYLVINHLGTAGADAYALSNVITPTGASIQITASTTAGEDQVTLTPGFRFASASSTQRVFLVSGPIAYLCDEHMHTIVRYSGYSMAANLSARDSPAELLAAGATGSRVADNIGSCETWIAAGRPQQQDLLGIYMQFAASDDRLRIFRQLAVEALP